MKKILFRIAAVAIAASVAMSCGNKKSSKSEATDAAAAEPVAEAAASEEEKLPEGPCTLEFDLFSVEVPAGWKTLSKDSHDLKIGLGTDYYNDEQIRFQEHTYQDLDDALKVRRGLSQTKDLGKLTFGSTTFYAFEDPTPELNLLVKANDKNEYVEAQVRRAAYKGESYKSILSTLKIKK